MIILFSYVKYSEASFPMTGQYTALLLVTTVIWILLWIGYRQNKINDAEKGIKELLEKKTKIMGFGHGVYKVQDPRSPIVKNWVAKLSNNESSKTRFEIAQKIDEVMDEEKKLFPNVDFYGGLLLAELGFEVDLFTPIFVAGRSVGWASHYFEQREQDILIRPAAKYIGPSER